MNLDRVIAVRTNETVYRDGMQCVKVFGDGFTKDDYAALVKGMFDGTITVSNDTSAEPAVTNVNVSWLGNLK